MEHDDAVRFYGVHERRCFGDLHECAGSRERVIHCGPADEINPQTTVVFEELATQIARALAKPISGAGRNLQELVAIHSRFEPVDDNFELAFHLYLRSSRRIRDRNARSPLRVKQRDVSTLCQYLDQTPSFLPKALSELRRRDHLSRRSPTEKPGRDLIRVPESVARQNLITRAFFGDKRPVLPLPHPAADVAAKSYEDVNGRALRARHCWAGVKSRGFHLQALDAIQAEGTLLLAHPAIGSEVPSAVGVAEP